MIILINHTKKEWMDARNYFATNNLPRGSRYKKNFTFVFVSAVARVSYMIFCPCYVTYFKLWIIIRFSFFIYLFFFLFFSYDLIVLRKPMPRNESTAMSINAAMLRDWHCFRVSKCHGRVRRFSTSDWPSCIVVSFDQCQWRKQSFAGFIYFQIILN